MTVFDHDVGATTAELLDFLLIIIDKRGFGAFVAIGTLTPLSTIVGEILDTGVHDADDIGIPVELGTLVRDGALVFLGLEEAVSLFHSHTIAALVAERPNDNGRIIAVAVEHIVDTINDGVGPLFLLSQTVFAIALGMAFDVGFVPDIETIAVAELVPILVVGVMAGADGIDIEVLHKHNIELHLLAADILAGIGAMLVAVDAADSDRPAVDTELAGAHNSVADIVLGLLDGHIAETDLAPEGFDKGAVGAFKTKNQSIQIGGFGGPRTNRRDDALVARVENEPVVNLDFLLLPEHTLALGIEKFHIHRHGRSEGGGQIDIQIEETVAGLFVDRGNNLVVANKDSRSGIKADVAGDAAHAPHILAFEIAAVAPADNFESQTIGARMDILGDIPLSGSFGIFAIAYAGAVDIEIHSGTNSAKLDKNTAAMPAFGHLEIGDITAGGVEIAGSVRGIGRELVVDIGIDGDAETLGFDIAWHLDIVPR